VTYNVARLVPETITQKVAVQKTEYQDVEVTVMEPYTTTKRMAVGTTYQYAYVDPFTGSTATAAGPTPATAEQSIPQRTAEGANAPMGDGAPFKGLSHPREIEPTPADEAPTGPVAQAPRRSTPSIVRAAGWRPARRPLPPVAAPERPAGDEPTAIAKN
jgi:hypothetical protein